MSNKAMDDHLWRVPKLVAVMACGALLLFTAIVVGSVVARRRPSMVTKLAVAATLGVLTVVIGVALRSTAHAIARTLEIDVAYVDPGLLGYLAPALLAALAWLIGNRVLQHSWTSRAALWYYAWLLAFTAANTINRCSPGWCMTVGFPFAWHSWSDAIFNDDSFRQFYNVMGAMLDLMTFAIVAVVLVRLAPGSSAPDRLR